MKKKNKDIEKTDKIIKEDYPFIGSIGTYFNFDLKEKSNVELEIEAMKKKEQFKDKKWRKEFKLIYRIIRHSIECLFHLEV